MFEVAKSFFGFCGKGLKLDEEGMAKRKWLGIGWHEYVPGDLRIVEIVDPVTGLKVERIVARQPGSKLTNLG